MTAHELASDQCHAGLHEMADICLVTCDHAHLPPISCREVICRLGTLHVDIQAFSNAPVDRKDKHIITLGSRNEAADDGAPVNRQYLFG
eukprot:4938947-Amphidinium_carterae.3